MSSETNAQHLPGHDDHGQEEHAHGSFRGYMIGFVLSVILTAIPFWLVMSGALGSNQLTGFAIMAFAVAQIIVHMVFFLHMNGTSEAAGRCWPWSSPSSSWSSRSPARCG